jgi:two-component system chemotaxis sensor kinase CheA
MPEDQANQVGGALATLETDAATGPAKALIADTLDTYQTFMDTVGFDDLLREMLLEKVNEMAALGPEAFGATAPAAEAEQPATPGPSESAPQEAPEGAAPAADHKHPDKTMRVSESHIDTFLAFVGEMLVVGDMFHHLQRRVDDELNGSDISASFRRTNETFANLSNDLQRSIMSIRRVAVRSLLQKVPRMVRDIASHSGKDIAVHVSGDDVEVDKSLIDLLDAPLTHMVRNAADHGIEPPEARKAAGKPVQGTVRVEVTETADMVVVSVSDDGAGLNLEAIRAKAESLELVKPGQELREQDIVNLLFSSGVSTAAAVTDVSGRGVGMDVVRRMIEEAGGRITVSTEAGSGSVFAVHVPKSVTTQIMSGFLVRTGGQVFVLSLDRVRETTKVEKHELESVTGKGRVVKLHGNILPVVSFGESMAINHINGARDFEVLVTVEAFKKEFALSVDDVIGVQQVVRRAIDGLETHTPAITGGALLGDGSVALIVDVEKMLDRRNDARQQPARS